MEKTEHKASAGQLVQVEDIILMTLLGTLPQSNICLHNSGPALVFLGYHVSSSTICLSRICIIFCFQAGTKLFLANNLMQNGPQCTMGATYLLRYLHWPLLKQCQQYHSSEVIVFLNTKVYASCQEQSHGKQAFENTVNAPTQPLLIDNCKIK